MSEPASGTRTVIVEREIPHPPEKIWRALTQPHLIAEWLMQNDFEPAVGHRFSLRANWGVVDCEVLVVEANKRLSYTWDTMGLKSVVTWTLTPAGAGSHLRLEHAGFPMDRDFAFQGATAGWQRFLAALEQTVARIS